MEQETRLDILLEYLLMERREPTVLPGSYSQKRDLFRSLVNVRPPLPLPHDILKTQDDFLQEEKELRGVVHLTEVSVLESDDRLSLWQGDITRLEADAIVNAANSRLLGCFVPGHNCIDNAIHTFSGMQLRQACHDLMCMQGHDEPTGAAKITPAFNLPSRYALHTVGPIVEGKLTRTHREELAGCYRSCLELAAQHDLASIAFCCVSTGVFGFPKMEAAAIAIRTVREFLE